MTEQFKTELIFYRAWNLIDQYERLFDKKITSSIWDKIVLKGIVKSVIKDHLKELVVLNFALNDDDFDDDLKCLRESFNQFVCQCKELRKPIGRFSIAMLHYDETDESLYLK